MRTEAEKKERQRLYDAQPHRKAARAASTKIWRANNPEAIAAMDKRKKEKKKTSFYSLYYLPEEHYIGVTNQLDLRMLNHRCKGKVTEGYEVIMNTHTKREALNIERRFHKFGFRGGNANYTKNK